MQLFFDVDGVLLNFEGAFVRFLNRAYAMGLPEQYETPSWLFKNLLTPEQMRERWQAFLEAEEAGEMGALVTPQDFNRCTREHAVYLLTNFPFPYMEKREQNLKRLGFCYASLHYCGLHAYREVVPPTKAEMVNRLRQEGARAFFMDDHPDNCLDVLNHCQNMEIWLMNRAFNKDFKNSRVRRAEGWSVLLPYLETLP